MWATFRDRDGSCLRVSIDADAAGKRDARRPFVSVRVRENRMKKINQLIQLETACIIHLSHVSPQIWSRDFNRLPSSRNWNTIGQWLTTDQSVNLLSSPSLEHPYSPTVVQPYFGDCVVWVNVNVPLC